MIKRITKKQFWEKLKKRKLEKLDVIKLIERSLKKQRGYIFQMPPKGAPVILLLSGGLDSVVSWGILMKEFGLSVYPISFDRSEKRASREQEAIEYFSKFYNELYPELFHPPVRLSLNVQDIAIPIENALHNIHPEVLLNKVDKQGDLIDLNLSFGTLLLLPTYAKLYAEYLYYKKNIYTRTIFCSVVLSDGLMVPHQTFTALRSIMYYLCATSGDYTWQFSSLVFEKETGVYYDKFNLVQWGHAHNIPLEKTWSCYYAKKYQCGSGCLTCVVRRNAFRKAGVQDKTIYRSVAHSVFHTLKRTIRPMIHKTKPLKNT